MQGDLSRRDFLKMSGLGLGAMAVQPFMDPLLGMEGGEVIRVATHSISVYSKPDDKSTILYQRHRDDWLMYTMKSSRRKDPDITQSGLRSGAVTCTARASRR